MVDRSWLVSDAWERRRAVIGLLEISRDALQSALPGASVKSIVRMTYASDTTTVGAPSMPQISALTVERFV